MKKIKLTLYRHFLCISNIHNIYTVSKNHKLNEKKIKPLETNNWIFEISRLSSKNP